MPRTQAERSETTIGELLDAAERLFTEQGYFATSIEHIVRAAGVTRGALYHHFTSKAAVFEAVFERQQQRLTEQIIRELSSEVDPWVQVRRGCELYLRETLDDAVRRITILDAPSALGRDLMCEINGRYLLGLLETALERATAAGRVHPGHTDARLHLLMGALSEAAVWIARSNSAAAATKQAVAELDRILDGFEVEPSTSRSTPRKAPARAGRRTRAGGSSARLPR